MGLKERIRFLTTAEQVDEFLRQNPESAIFKAGTCHKTQEGFAHVQAQIEDREDLPLGIIRVVEARPASNRVAELTGIRHESPQFLLFQDAKAVFARDNWQITAESLAEAFTRHTGGIARTGPL